VQQKVRSNTAYLESIANISTIPESFEEIVEGNKSFVSEISNCIKKLAFASWSEEIEESYVQLQIARPDVHVSLGEESNFTDHNGWKVSAWMDAITYQRMDALMRSGIAKEWHDFSRLQRLRLFWKQLAKLEKGWREITMSHNVVVIFHLLIIGHALSSLLCLVELFVMHIKTI
jgi:hypothetical protein